MVVFKYILDQRFEVRGGFFDLLSITVSSMEDENEQKGEIIHHKNEQMGELIHLIVTCSGYRYFLSDFAGQFIPVIICNIIIIPFVTVF